MDNVLQAEQKKKDPGAYTFAKYWYQYNWALVKFLDECETRKNCSLSIECNEDVMIIDDYTSHLTKVDLYQVKEKSSSKQITARILAYGGNDNGKSIISKLVSNLDKQLLKDRISKLAIVSSVPIKMNLKCNRDSALISSFRWEDISESDSNILMESLKRDLSREEVPLFVEFIKGIEGYNELTHSSIAFKKLSEYIDKISPSMACQPKVIFELIRSELVRIGTDVNIYSVWNDFIREKSITSKSLNEIIKYRSVPLSGSNFDGIWNDIKKSDYCSKMNITETMKFKKSCKAYFEMRLTSTNYSIFNDISALMNDVCNCTELESYIEFVNILIESVKKNEAICEYFNGTDVTLESIANVELSGAL
ncbi:DUF4297 domain-containing protein [Vibrio cholerae]|uniref:dsDNA nuclease domain-containing protein n=3 Tax=Vibrio TaxID=662 RepID=UPI002E9EB2DC|nr:DUF4297 domain-containing protein [Vibrio cholerae]EJL7015526.1 DUF4297 domain-containing protein [Vibrio cholerae]EJS1626464.1 DUF4297 domain-containing protein [Vibrio cholerae]MEE3773984.1 dsDNA nuclease domain-containing protein [Vibrio cholerae]